MRRQHFSIFYRSESRDEDPELRADCNNKCVCPRNDYLPICGVDEVQYFSSCHAGCDHVYFSRPRNAWVR